MSARARPPSAGDPEPPAPGTLAEELFTLWARPRARRWKSPRTAASRGEESPRPSNAGEEVARVERPARARAGAEPASARSASFDEDFGRAIAYLRGSRSQAEVARRGGLSRASWSLYELGKRRARERNLAKVLQGLGCSREQLDSTAWKIHRGRLLASMPEIVLPEEVPLAAGAPSSGGGGQVADRPGPRGPDAELRSLLRAMLSSLADPLAEALVLAVRAALSKRPAPPAGR